MKHIDTLGGMMLLSDEEIEAIDINCGMKEAETGLYQGRLFYEKQIARAQLKKVAEELTLGSGGDLTDKGITHYLISAEDWQSLLKECDD